jgi:hypothetical protein
MFDELFKMIQESGQQTVVENQDVPNEHNEDVMREAHSAIVNELSSVNSPEQANSLLGSVQSGQAQSNPAVQRISDNFMGNIMQKFGIGSGAAASIASSIIPMVLGRMLSKGQQSGGGGLDLGGLLSSLTNGSGASSLNRTSTNSSSGLGGKLGLDKDGDGDVDLNDLTKMFK